MLTTEWVLMELAEALAAPEAHSTTVAFLQLSANSTRYGAFSIGRSMVARTRRYIANQKEHHRKKSFQEEFRGFLEKYEIEYDERYVWD